MCLVEKKENKKKIIFNYLVERKNKEQKKS